MEPVIEAKEIMDNNLLSLLLLLQLYTAGFKEIECGRDKTKAKERRAHYERSLGGLRS